MTGSAQAAVPGLRARGSSASVPSPAFPPSPCCLPWVHPSLACHLALLPAPAPVREPMSGCFIQASSCQDCRATGDLRLQYVLFAEKTEKSVSRYHTEARDSTVHTLAALYHRAAVLRQFVHGTTPIGHLLCATCPGVEPEQSRWNSLLL